MPRNENLKLGLSRGRSVLGSNTWEQLVTLSNVTASGANPKPFITEGITAYDSDRGMYVAWTSGSQYAAGSAQGGIFVNPKSVHLSNGYADANDTRYHVQRIGTNIDGAAFAATANVDNEQVVGICLNENSSSGNPMAVQYHGTVDIRIDNTVNVGDFIDLSTVQASGSSNGTTGGIGTFGFALTSGSAGDVVTIFFRGIETN